MNYNTGPNHSTTCRKCPAKIFFILSKKGHRMIVDFEPVTVHDDNPKIRLVHLDGTVQVGARPGDWGYIDHHATCPAVDQFRRKR